MSERVILQGDLSAIMLPDVLTFFNMIRQTGELVVRHDGVEKTIFWDDGEIVFATSSLPQDALGPFLLRNGRITEDQYHQSQDQLTPGKRHGKLLVQMGILSPKELWWGVKNQVLDIIYSLFPWRDGTFTFVETPVDLETGAEKITLAMDTTNIVMEGIRRLDEWERIREKVPTPEVVFRTMPVTQERLASLRLPETERQVLGAVDGQRTARELVRVTGLTEFDTFRILFSLAAAHLLEEVEQERAKPPVFFDVEDSPELLKVANTYKAMFERLHDVLVDRIGESQGRRIFGKVLETAESNELFTGVTFDERGRFDENLLIGNVSELPFEQRRPALDEGLNTLLSFQLFEVTQHLDPDTKKEMYRFITDKKRELE